VEKVKMKIKVIVSLATAALFTSGYILSMNVPLGPHLYIDQPAVRTELITDNAVALDAGDSSSADIEPPADDAADTCDQSGKMTMLFLGENLPETPERGADAIRLLRADFDNKLINVLALSPDVQVERPVLASEAIENPTLTNVYYLGKESKSGSESEKMIEGMRYISQTLFNNFGYHPSHYVIIKQSLMEDIVDTLGGLPINLTEDVDGTSEGFGYFSEGEQVMNGQQVLNYVRILNPTNVTGSSELNRIKRQNQILAALAAQMGSSETIAKLPILMMQFYESLTTDLNIQQVEALFCLLGDDEVKINYIEVPSDMFASGKNRILIPKDYNNLGKYIIENAGQ
jgi:LCP family protein required for cell wall assembly